MDWYIGASQQDGGSDMSQCILVQSYIGILDFTFEVECSGRELVGSESAEFRSQNNGKSWEKRRADYRISWHEISPGDWIDVYMVDGAHWTNNRYTIPEGGLPDPPTSLEDDRYAGKFERYLKKYCEVTDLR